DGAALFIGGGFDEAVVDGLADALVVQEFGGAALREPQFEHDALDAAVLVVQDLPGVRRGRAFREPGGVGGGVLDVPPPGAADVAVRARPDAPPVGARPIQHVVPAPGVRTGGPVGDLVPVEAVRGERLVGDQVPVGHGV